MSLLDNFVFPSEPPTEVHAKNLEINLDRYFAKLKSILNQGLNFKENFNCLQTTITTDAAPGNPTVITHGLKRIPTGFLIAEKDKAAHIYKSAKDLTTYTIKSDVASVTATLIIF